MAKLTLLEAEVLIWQGQYKDALALLNRAVPPRPWSNDGRRKALQSMANTFLRTSIWRIALPKRPKNSPWQEPRTSSLMSI